GLIARGIKPEQIIVSDPAPTQRDGLSAEFGIRVTDDNSFAARASQVVVLAVKPQELRSVATQLAPSLTHRPVVLSVAAGIRAADLRKWLGELPVVRCMPNRPALNGAGVTGLFATSDVDSSAKELAAEILGAVGPALWVDLEAQMDVVTAVSGSGPAYFFLLIEMLEASGTQLGLPAEVARRLAIETAYGAGIMAKTATESPATLREQVTSKGGTTEAALKSLEEAKVRDIFADAVAAAAKRSAELAEQLSKQ
ncbi:MAG TPA: pyrroline-5-carboxylate reductase, partial [Steroidobacteraceae bacterium]|nr:pyrroline-5-carboxylate reductase [Steroidobacteraceae bacterium]